MSSSDISLRVAARFRKQATELASAEDFLPTAQALLNLLAAWKQWLGKFPAVLRVSEQEAVGLPDGWVWQARFVKFTESNFTEREEKLRDLQEQMENVYLYVPYLADAANMILWALHIPKEAQIDYVLKSFQFFAHPGTERDEIAYKVNAEKKWSTELEKWIGSASRGIQDAIRRGKRQLQRHKK